MAETLHIILDASSALEHPLTGVGYVALHQTSALAALNGGLELRLFGTRARGVALPAEWRQSFTRSFVVPGTRRLKLALWSRWNWPPVEWFCGTADIAHGLFHLLPAAAAARRLVTVHDLVVFRHPETHTAATVCTHRRLLQHAARNADALIAVSESCRQDILEVLNVPPERVFVVPNGVCIEDFEGAVDPAALARCRQELGLRSDYWIYIGTIEPRKNLTRLLTAYRRIVDRFSDCPDLLLVGRSGWHAEPIFQAIGDLRLENRVFHAGYLARSEVILLLRNAAACLYPSLYEGFGLPVLEAMAAGVPVLTSNISALPEVIGPCGVLIDPEEPDSLEAGMETLLQQPGACARMAREARERARGFSWENSAQRLAQVYRTVHQDGPWSE
ncbi:MAG TPA: glycosyltransferase family 1 protein [Candidatus Hydrogenedentes bacterium]|nr:glycosyltransferase family 1 protein [Candidatus Hydrogenedentota bacterium]HPK00555.1 glycosyltransferase family 1 protein [Candidatus Hydrogenedentota bacterium]